MLCFAAFLHPAIADTHIVADVYFYWIDILTHTDALQFLSLITVLLFNTVQPNS